MGHLDNAMEAYERALAQNPYSVSALNAISCILRTKEQFPKAVEYLQSILNLEQNNGEVWGSLGKFLLLCVLGARKPHAPNNLVRNTLT